DREGRPAYTSAIRLNGNAVMDDDPLASVYWLPVYDVVDRNESTYRRTVRSASSEHRFLVQQCARLLGPEAADVMQWVRRAPLDDGFESAQTDEDGSAPDHRGVADFAREHDDM